MITDPICILGMHRSNTSMVANILEKCGVYLGPEEFQLPAASDNPAGFGEDTRFIEINNSILQVLGGTWDEPPAMPQGWSENTALAGLKASAIVLIESFKGHEPWAWKDPRTCLTLEFWFNLIPNLRGVVCLRDPVEAAVSLMLRDSLSIAEVINLWGLYYKSVVHLRRTVPMIVTHGTSYLLECEAEVERVASFLNLDMTGKLDPACSVVKRGLVSSKFYNPTPLPKEIEELNEELCDLAGPVFKRVLQNPVYIEQDQIKTLEQALGRIEKLQKQMEIQAARHRSDRSAIVHLRQYADDCQEQIGARDYQISLVETQVHLEQEETLKRDETVKRLSTRLDQIQRDPWFKIGSRLGRFKG